MYNDFYGRFISFMQKTCKGSCVMLMNFHTCKIRKFWTLESFTPSDIQDSIDRWRSVTFCTADSSAMTSAFLAYARKSQGNYEFQDLEVPATDEGADPAVWLPRINKYGMATAIQSNDVHYKPVILLDIDLKDNRRYLLEKGLITEYEFSELETGTNPRSAMTMHDMPVERRLECVKALLDIDKLVDETGPSLVMFSGGGIHIWYACTVKTDAERYKDTHGMIARKVAELFPHLKHDGSACHINQNIRLPGSFNLKGKDPVMCTVLYEATMFEMPPWIKEYHASLKPGVTGQTRKGFVSKEGFFANSHILNIINITAGTGKYRRGLRNIRRDPRLWKLVKEHLTFQSICDYMNVQIDNFTEYNAQPDAPKTDNDTGQTDTEKDPYYKCSSPLRKDNNPSFFVFPNAMLCRDMGRNMREYDYGELMYELLKIVKERLGIHRDTTYYEAEFHCVFCAYLVYRSVTGKEKLPMVDMEEHRRFVKEAEAKGMEMTPQAKRFPQGMKYYSNLQSLCARSLNVVHKQPGAEYREHLRHFIKAAPPIYYFYDPNQASSSSAYLTNAVALAVIYFFNRLNVGIQVLGPNKYNIYVVNKHGLHQLWAEWIPVNTLAGDNEKRSESIIHEFLVFANITESGTTPVGTPPLAKYIMSQFARLDQLDLTLKDYIGYHEVTEHSLKLAVSTIISDNLPSVKISPEELHINLLNDEHYIEFNNKLVLYDAKDISKIGQVVIPKTYPAKHKMLRTSVIDLRIEHFYEEKSGTTPLWDAYIESMTYRDNKFREGISYFLGSMLYRPAGVPTRALLIYGYKGDNGKSVIAIIIKGLLGRNHVTLKDIADISSTSDRGKNSRYALIDSIVNITQDNEKNKIEGAFKTMVEGETVQVRELYAHEREVDLRTHYLINTNRLPETWGETQPLLKRILLLRVGKVIPPDKRIDSLGERIVNSEAHYIWPWILSQARLFREKGLLGFIEYADLKRLEAEFLLDNELYIFVKDYVMYDPKSKWHISRTTFKRLYNKYRSYINKNVIKSDNVANEAEMFIQDKYKDVLPEGVMEQGFEYRTENRRGLPVRIYVPENSIGNTIAIDSEDLINN